MDLWRDMLNCPTKIVAPMVDASELPWRLLCRRYGAELCYTPMLHSNIFIKDPKYRKEALATCNEDKPLIVQFCGNDPGIILQASKMCEDFCSAIDINLGCPQAIAKRGHYGAFLQDEWPLIENIVQTLSTNLKIPVTCKIRRFETVEKTVKYAQMLEKAGCSMLTVHGRTREMKGPLTGIADWTYVTEVRKAVNIPVISNGNIQCIQDVYRCLEETGAVGVMTAEGNLYNPALFLGISPPSWEPAREYLDLVRQYQCPLSYVRGHLFKLFQHLLSLQENNKIRIRLGEANSLELFDEIVEELKNKYLPFHEGLELWQCTAEEGTQNLTMPPWLCQPYVRMNVEDHKKKVEENTQVEDACDSTRWLEGFKKRNDVVFKNICGESNSVDNIECNEWIKNLPILLHRYSPDDVFNADEALFYKCLPDKTFTFKGQPCHGGELSKERVTVLVCANMPGTEKLPLLLIGKSKNPRCFKGVKTFPVNYQNNKKAWMTVTSDF